MSYLCVLSISSVSCSALVLLLVRCVLTLFCALVFWFLSAADGFQIGLGSGELHLFLPQSSLQLFVQVVPDGLSSGPAFAELLVQQVLQLGTRVSFSKPAGDAVPTFAEGVEQVAPIAQIRRFGGHVLAHVVDEAAFVAVEAFGFSLLEETQITHTYGEEEQTFSS